MTWLSGSNASHTALLQELLASDKTAGVRADKAIVTPDNLNTSTTATAEQCVVVLPLFKNSETRTLSPLNAERSDGSVDSLLSGMQQDEASGRMAKGTDNLYGMIALRFRSKRSTTAAETQGGILRDNLSNLRGAVIAAADRILLDDAAAKHARRLENKNEQHRALKTVVETLSATTTEDEAKTAALQAARSLIQCARVDVYSATQDQAMLIWHDADKAATMNLAQSPDLMVPMQGLVGHAVTSRMVVNVEGAADHALFAKETDQRSDRCRPVNLLVAPMCLGVGTQSEFAIGAIQVTNKLDGSAFDESDALILSQLSAISAMSIYNNHRQTRQAQVVGALSRVCTSLDVVTILHHVVACLNDWAHGKALSTRVWVRDCRNTNCLQLCAIQFTTGRPYIRSHLARNMAESRILLEEADDNVYSCYKRASLMVAGEAITGSEARLHLPLLPSPAGGMSDEGSAAAAAECGQALGVLQVNFTRGTLQLTHAEVELLQSVAAQCAAALANAETHFEDARTNEQIARMCTHAWPIFQCRSSASVFPAVCTAAASLAPSLAISVFSVDPEGKRVLQEYSDTGAVTPASSPSYKLKLSLAASALESLALQAASSQHEDDEDSKHVRRHCCTTLLYKTGVMPTLHKQDAVSEGAADGHAVSRAVVDIGVFAILVCIREQKQGSYTDSEVKPLQSLAVLAADHLHRLKSAAMNKASHFIANLQGGQAQIKTAAKPSGSPTLHADLANSTSPAPPPASSSATVKTDERSARDSHGRQGRIMELAANNGSVASSAGLASGLGEGDDTSGQALLDNGEAERLSSRTAVGELGGASDSAGADTNEGNGGASGRQDRMETQADALGCPTVAPSSETDDLKALATSLGDAGAQDGNKESTSETNGRDNSWTEQTKPSEERSARSTAPPSASVAMQGLSSDGGEVNRLKEELSGVYNNAGAAMKTGGDTARSAEYFRKALALRIDLSGPGTASEATIRINLGSAMMAAGLLDEAGEQFQNALKIRETLLGVDHDSTKAARKWVAKHAKALDTKSNEEDVEARTPGPDKLETEVGEAKGKVDGVDAETPVPQRRLRLGTVRGDDGGGEGSEGIVSSSREVDSDEERELQWQQEQEMARRALENNMEAS